MPLMLVLSKIRNVKYFSIAWFRADVDLPKNFLWESAIFHSIKLSFDVQAAEKILHVI